MHAGVRRTGFFLKMIIIRANDLRTFLRFIFKMNVRVHTIQKKIKHSSGFFSSSSSPVACTHFSKDKHNYSCSAQKRILYDTT